jgi:hypothetical protein
VLLNRRRQWCVVYVRDTSRPYLKVARALDEDLDVGRTTVDELGNRWMNLCQWAEK